ncbi:hypothetical protein FVR03_10425 [Pontibacter qinzhouensis]|uniref:Uncharacterized protein n=1 Tax=Pontibacter qinzhouensis TaxID=2603253 RepID=A0A5C8K8D8_9BACT|nr:hypothetical protein [Pontibacter qinzhouensis]TXK46749.1 hypothetical protein FVR03_10425 [Pontibacter qinzhouensis]
MTLDIRNNWNALNRALTIINLFLFMVLTAQGFNYEELKDKKIPIVLNVLLLLIMGSIAFIVIYKLV